MTWGWVIDHWRLKLLSLGLALVLFGTVAFAQNPLVIRTITVQRISFEITDPDLVVLQPPSKLPVTVSGLRDAVSTVDPSQVTVTFDLTHVSAPTNGTKSINVTPDIAIPVAGVSVRNQTGFGLTVDSEADAVLQIDMRVQPAPGWKLDPAKSFIADPNHSEAHVTSVHLHGPESQLDGLQAYVEYDKEIGVTTYGISGLKVQYENRAGNAVKWPLPTFPLSSADISTVDLQIGAKQVSVQKQVPVTLQVSGAPACGYEMTGLSWSSPLVTLTGSPDALASISSLTASPTLNIDGATGNVSSGPLTVSAGAGVVVTPATDTATAQIRQVFSCTPATPPPPSPTPSPVPTPT